MYEMTVKEMLYDVKYTKKHKLCRCTVEYFTEDGVRTIRHWRTDILKFHPNGDIIISTGGYWTQSTIRRVNKYLNMNIHNSAYLYKKSGCAGAYLYKKRGVRLYWCTSTPDKDYIYQEAMKVDKRGIPYPPVEEYVPRRRSSLKTEW